MILNNYYKWLGANQRYSIQADATSQDVGLKAIDGENALMLCGNPYGNNSSWWGALAQTRSIDNCALCIGTGENTYESGDYCLVNDITANLSGVQYTKGYSYDNNFTRLFTITFTNSTSSEITVTEIGIKKVIYSDPTRYKDVMMAIIQLDDPISVPVGATATVAVTWIDE